MLTQFTYIHIPAACHNDTVLISMWHGRCMHSVECHPVWMNLINCSVIFFITLPLIEEWSIVMTMSVSLCVCVCVCLSANISLEILVQSLPIYCTCYLWLWLSPPLATLRYIMYFQFSISLVHKPRQLNMAAQLMLAQRTCCGGLGYNLCIGLPVVGW